MSVSAKTSPTPTYTHIRTGYIRRYIRMYFQNGMPFLPTCHTLLQPPIIRPLHPPATPPSTHPSHAPSTHPSHAPSTHLPHLPPPTHHMHPPLTCSRDQNINHWCYFLQSDHFEAVHAAGRHRLGLPWQPAARLTNRNTAVRSMLLKATLTAQHMTPLDCLVCTCIPI